MRKVAVNLKDTWIGDFLPACEDDAQLLLTGHDSGVGKKVAGIGSLPSFDFASSGEVAGEHKATTVPRRTSDSAILLCKGSALCRGADPRGSERPVKGAPENDIGDAGYGFRSIECRSEEHTYELQSLMRNS